MDGVSDSSLAKELNRTIRVFQVAENSIDPNAAFRQPPNQFINNIETTLKTLQCYLPSNFIKNFIVTPASEMGNPALLSTQLPAELNTEKANADKIYSEQIIERGLSDQTPQSRRNLLQDQIDDHNGLIEETNEAIEFAIKEFKLRDIPSVYKPVPRQRRQGIPMYEFMDGFT